MTEIRKKGHDVCIIAPFDAYSKRFDQLGIEWHRLNLHQTGKNPIKELYSFLHLFLLMRKMLPDVVLTFTIKCNLYAGLLRRLCGFHQIANISGLGEIFDKHSFFTMLICRLYKTALRNSQKVFFQNLDDLHIFVRKGILCPNICERIPGSGVDLLRFTPSIASTSGKKRVFLMFGRIVPHKGYDLFLQAAQSLLQKHSGNVEFWVLGIKDVSRKDSEKLFQKIMDFHERNVIKYFPETDNVIPLLHQSDVVVLPSQYHEGVPRSLLEAMACEKPIITTNWKGCRDTVHEGVNGWLIEKGNLEALKKAITFFIQADSGVLHQMGEASRKKAEQEFDEHIIISRYLTEIRAGR